MDRWGLLVKDAVIDGDYVGELYMYVHNLTNEDVYLPPHIRIGQIIVIPHTTINFNQKNVLSFKKTNSRGVQGFGSSGK